MKMNRAIPRLLVLFVAFMLTSLAASAQSPCDGVVMPAGTICISQAAGNAAAENKQELDATKAKVGVLTEALTEKDKIIESVRATASKNEADLKAALTNTQTDLATKTGQLIGSEASNVRHLAIIDLLLKQTRKKCLPFSICL